jgi:hypothetical protein
MPATLRDFHRHINAVSESLGLSPAEQMFVVGWLFADIFELADHEEAKGAVVGAVDLDRFARGVPETKIRREVCNAQQAFGQAAAAFMEKEIQIRIRTAMDQSIVTAVREYTNSRKAFFLNVTAGVVSGVIFAALILFGNNIAMHDPSPIQLGHALEQRLSNSSPSAAKAP